MNIFEQASGNVTPVYRDDRLKIAVVPNPNDGPDGYYFIVGNAHFILPSRVLSDLARPEYGTEDVMRSLTAVNDMIPRLIGGAGVSPDQLHIALLKVRQRELEEERTTFLEQAVGKL